MRKILMAAAALCCMTMTMMAEPVSPSAARQAAEKFLQRNGIVLKSEVMRAPRRAMGRATDNQEQTKASPYYVFNASASKGFVIVSGDDCVGDNLVLGYTVQGSFEADNIPDNMQWWLDEMEYQISELSRRGAKARTVALHDDVTPLVTALWDQGANQFNPQRPYNAFCPETDGQLCVTGCMATALSMVLYYHRWPQGPLAGELPAYTMANGRVIDGLPATTFNWDDMVDDYNQPTTDVQQAAVATLMRYCGQLIQMDYTPQESSGYFYDVDMLVKLFGYDQGVYRANADNYTVSGWDKLLYNELREGRPLVYGGTSTGGGHAFVVDGYEVQDGGGYFHVNWGWGRNSNGFYKISLLNPAASGTGGSTTSDGYSFGQNALIGLMPAQHSTEAYGRYLTGFTWNGRSSESHRTCSDGRVVTDEDKVNGRSSESHRTCSDGRVVTDEDKVNGTDDGRPHVFAAANTSRMPGVFDIALAHCLADGTADYSHLIGQRALEMAGYCFAGLNTEEHPGLNLFTLPENFAEGLAVGRHELVFVNKEAGTEAPWRPIFGPNCYIEVNIGDDGLATDTLFHPLPQLTTSSQTIKIEGMKQRGIRQNVTAVISNNSDDDYIGNVECGVYYVENGELKSLSHFSRTGIMIEANGETDITFGPSVRQTGNYVLVLTNGGEDMSGSKLANVKQSKGYIGHGSFTIDELAFYCLDLQYSERSDEEGNPAYYLDVNVANGTPMDYNAALLAKLYTPNSEGGYDPFVFPGNPDLYSMISLASNYWRATSIRLPEALEPGEYGIDLLIANDFQSLKPDDYFVFASGPITVTSSTGISTADNEEWNTTGGNAPWFTLDGRKLDSRPTTKGIYIYKGIKVKR